MENTVEGKPGRSPRSKGSGVGAADAAWGTSTPKVAGAAVEAILLSSDRAVSPARLAEALGLIGAEESAFLPAGAARAIASAVEELNAEYDKSGRSFRIELVAGGYRAMTCPEFAGAVAALQQQRARHRLSRAGVESLAIVAYRQPITRAELEAIRGVACGEVLRTLIDHRLVAIVGRAEELGRPMLYGTTRQFLDVFGLASLKDLPRVGDAGARVGVEGGDVQAGERVSGAGEEAGGA